MAKSREKLKAREIRKRGKSIKFIARKLKVSPGSVSLWCKDIKLTSEQIKILEQHTRDPYYGRRLSYSLRQQKEREKKTRMLINQGVEEVGRLSKRDLFMAGIALYWGEGFKKDSQAGLASMDPAIIRFFIKWLKDCFGYVNEDLIFRVTLNISHADRIEDVLKYWSGTLSIPEAYFQKPFYQKFIWKKVYENPNDYYGVLRVKVRKSTDFLRKLNGYIEGLRLQAR